MAGRRPTPTQLKLVRGNPGKRPINKREPKPSSKAPRMPVGMSSQARAVWKKLLPLLQSMGVLSEVDGYALQRLAECYADIVELQKVIRRDGHTYEAESNTGAVMVRPRPEVGMLADADRRFKGYLIEFGLTPAARSKVEANGEKPKDKDPAEGYF